MQSKTQYPSIVLESPSAFPVYKAFGLNLSCCLPCPELVPGQGACDVSVAYGDVPLTLAGAKNNGGYFQAKPGELLLYANRVARFLVRNGAEILIDRDPFARDDEVRLFLLGSAMGGLIHQRGLLPLHGSTIKVGEGCVVFLGMSGAGKSTVATVLRHRGYTCIGDDVCAITIADDGVPYAAPAYPQAKLWVDTLEHFGIDARKLRRVRPSMEKRAVPLDFACDQDQVRVKRIYVLSPNPNKKEPILKPVRGPAKCRVLRDYTYRVEYLQGLDLAAQHFKQIAHLASRLPIIRAVRPSETFATDALADAIEGDFRSSLAVPVPLDPVLPSLFTEKEMKYG